MVIVRWVKFFSRRLITNHLCRRSVEWISVSKCAGAIELGVLTALSLAWDASNCCLRVFMVAAVVVAVCRAVASSDRKRSISTKVSASLC